MTPEERLDVAIEADRRALRGSVTQGKNREADIEAAHLAGLLLARSFFVAPQYGSCVHPSHLTAGLDAFGNTLWRCGSCGEMTNA